MYSVPPCNLPSCRPSQDKTQVPAGNEQHVLLFIYFFRIFFFLAGTTENNKKPSGGKNHVSDTYQRERERKLVSDFGAGWSLKSCLLM